MLPPYMKIVVAHRVIVGDVASVTLFPRLGVGLGYNGHIE